MTASLYPTMYAGTSEASIEARAHVPAEDETVGRLAELTADTDALTACRQMFAPDMASR